MLFQIEVILKMNCKQDEFVPVLGKQVNIIFSRKLNVDVHGLTVDHSVYNVVLP